MKEIVTSDYKEAEDFLNNIPKFTAKNPMEETKGFYDYLQACDGGIYSEKNMGKIVHVAGTNGKGSVCAFLQSICIESGYRTGMFISPHLITTRERFVIDGEIISEEEFLEAFNWLSVKLGEYRRIKPKYSPTYFERLFFMGVYVFTKAKIDITILETGLGGRLDTTNVIKNPVVTVITEIGFDHMAYLGDTIEKIAGEKAGIIKPGVPVVYSDRKNEVSGVLVKKAEEFGCKYYSVSKNDYKINEIKKKYIDFSVVSRYYDYCSLIADTTAVYQAENGAIAVRTAELLNKDCDLNKITADSIKAGIKKMHWAGRMEEVLPGVFIDGAHNEDGIEAFVQSLNSVHDFRDMEKDTKCVIVFSVVKDKQYDRMIEMLCGISFVTDFVITHIPGERGANLAEIGSIFAGYVENAPWKIHTCEKIEDAIKYGMGLKGDNGVMYVVGSLYLAGLVEEILTGISVVEENYDKF